MKFKEFWQMLQLELKKSNISINKFNVGNSYFIFDKGDNSVVHYTIEGLSGWQFGIWLEYNENQDIEYIQHFTQHQDNIDKFKPSRSSFCIKGKDCNENIWQTIDMIKLIKCCKISSYLYDAQGEIYVNPIKRLFEFIKLFIYNKKYRLEKWYEASSPSFINISYLKLKWIKLMLRLFYSDCITNVEILDKNKKSNLLIYPRFELIARWKEKDKEYVEPMVYLHRHSNGKQRYYKNADISLTDIGKYRGYVYEPISEDEIIKTYGWRYKLNKIIGRAKEK